MMAIEGIWFDETSWCEYIVGKLHRALRLSAGIDQEVDGAATEFRTILLSDSRSFDIGSIK